MRILLANAERGFNTCEFATPLRRTRPSILKSEAAEDHRGVWRVWGFGWKSKPSAYSWCAGLAARTAQGVPRPAPADSGLSSVPRVASNSMWTTLLFLVSARRLRSTSPLTS